MHKKLFFRIIAVLFLAALGAVPASAQSDTETVSFEIEIEPVFAMETSSAQAGAIHLSLSSSASGGFSQTATVSVWTNRKVPYRIVQRLEDVVVNEKGLELPLQQIRFSVTDGAQGGRSEIKSPAALSSGTVPIFSSGPEGKSDQFTITYSMGGGERVMPAGNYRARISIQEEFR